MSDHADPCLKEGGERYGEWISFRYRYGVSKI